MIISDTSKRDFEWDECESYFHNLISIALRFGECNEVILP